MEELGKKDFLVGTLLTELNPLSLFGRPTNLPSVPLNHKIICGFDMGFGEKMFVCDNLEEMQERYDKYAQGWASRISWYTSRIERINYIHLAPSFGIAGSIINAEAPNAPLEVKLILASYAKGNSGAAKVLSVRAAYFTTAKQVEELVGWPLSEHSLDRTSEIWDRFKN